MVVTAAAALALPHCAVLAQSPDEFFEAKVRPLLADRCLKCHGETKPKAGLRLDARIRVLTGGESGPAASPGKPGESLIVQAVKYQDEPKMPPSGKLSDDEIATISKWVEIGLPWPDAKPDPTTAGSAATPIGLPYPIRDEQRKFWSFQPIVDPRPPQVVDKAWPSSAIDTFILARLEAEKLEPAAKADKRTLIRRATYDLTGLPPSIQEVGDFVRDESPDAFAKVVDRLLASPRYGEHWARHWLDLVRYTDSFDSRGLGSPGDVGEAYRYRDWVVNALNRDLPYDQFVIRQLAGDVMPGLEDEADAVDAMTATGMLVIGDWGPGDADKEKMVADIVNDQVDVTSRVFLGLTVACARCHDHKFDPIGADDYYGMAGVFFSSHIVADPGRKTDGTPVMKTKLATKARLEEIEAKKRKVAEAENSLKSLRSEAQKVVARLRAKDVGQCLALVWNIQHQSGQSNATVEDLASEQGLDVGIVRQWLDLMGMSQGTTFDKPTANVNGIGGVHSWGSRSDAASLTINTLEKPIKIATLDLPARSVSVHPGQASSAAITWKSPKAGLFEVRARSSTPIRSAATEWRGD